MPKWAKVLLVLSGVGMVLLLAAGIVVPMMLQRGFERRGRSSANPTPWTAASARLPTRAEAARG